MSNVRLWFEKIKPVLNSYSEVFFLQGSWTGLGLLLISCLNPHLGLSGLIAISAAYGFARFMGYQAGFLQSGYYTYNALLVGLAIGALFELSWLSVPFIAITAVLTFVLTLGMANAFYQLFQLKILSIPFVIVSCLVYLAASRYSNLYVNDLYTNPLILQVSNDGLPIWLAGFLKSLGAILFMPNWLTGGLIGLMILASSRVLFVLAFCGFMVGTFIQGLFTGSYLNAVNDIAAFNYILIAMALGGVFNIPSPRSYALALVGVAMATVLISSTDVFWSQYGIPAFTLPFTLITLGMTYILGLLQYPLRPVIFKASPEETAEYFHTARLRYASSRLLHLPFNGEWTVYQGFDGKWTHKGLWRHAYDFYQTDAQGQSFQGEGKQLQDYYCYQQQVCSPVKGCVVYVANQFPDNPVGVVDTINNWGNMVIIQDLLGYYVALCHLSPQQVFVKPGDWVEPYQVVGLCGNSGYSPQPHLHLQYQYSSYMSSATIPFCFTGLIDGKRFKHHDLPAEQTRVKPAYCHAYYIQIANFVLDETLSFEVSYQGNVIGNIVFSTAMASDGTFYLSRQGSKLYLGKTDSAFYFYHLEGEDPYLKLLYQALPSLPFNYLPSQSWADFIPIALIGSRWQQLIVPLKQVFGQGKAFNNAEYHFENDTTVCGVIKPPYGTKTITTRLILNPYVKFSQINVGEYQLTATTDLKDDLL